MLADLLFKRGRAHASSVDLASAMGDFEAAAEVIGGDSQVMEQTTHYLDLVEWIGVCKHLSWDLNGARDYYNECLAAEGDNVEVLVKAAGVQMDGGNYEEAKAIFDRALAINPADPDALLHRSNLHMLNRDLDGAFADLERCLQSSPDFLAARLRLATVYMHRGDEKAATACLDSAASIAPHSSDVHSYWGELAFQNGEIDAAMEKFQKAIECEPMNPTPYCNMALTRLQLATNTGGNPAEEAPGIIGLFEKSVQVDPMNTAAYLHLGQLKLSLAKVPKDVDEVIDLYNKGIVKSRGTDEILDLLQALIMAKAQKRAAELLGMAVFDMKID